MTYYNDNPAIAERRSLEDILTMFTSSEIRALKTMTPEEIEYLRTECDIDDYVNYLRRGKDNKALGSDFTIPIVKGTPLQLERFKMVFLLTLADFQGWKYYYPSQFSLGEEVLEEIRTYTGVAVIKIVKGASTTEGLDIFRTELILSSVAARRDYFNPTIILTEESIAGKLNVSNELTKVIVLDPKKLRGSYDGKAVYSDVQVSRVKAPAPVYKAPEKTYTPSKSSNTSSYQQKTYGKKPKKLSVNDMMKQRKEEEQ